MAIITNSNSPIYYELKSFSDEQNKQIGLTCITKGQAEAEAEIKRIIRKMPPHTPYITYGFKKINSNEFAYIDNLYISDNANINEKLSFYKSIKNFFSEINFTATENYILSSGEIDFSAKNKSTKEKTQYVLDKNKPIKIRR